MLLGAEPLDGIADEMVGEERQRQFPSFAEMVAEPGFAVFDGVHGQRLVVFNVMPHGGAVLQIVERQLEERRRFRPLRAQMTARFHATAAPRVMSAAADREVVIHGHRR